MTATGGFGGLAMLAILLLLLPAHAQMYGYDRITGGYYIGQSMDGPQPQQPAGPGNYCPSCQNGWTPQQQIHYLRERVDQLEREVESLRRISMHDWNATEGGSLYKVFGTAKKWPDAEQACKSYGAKLASIDSDQKNDYIRDLIQHSFGDVGIVDGFGDMEVWIGLKAKAEMLSSGSSNSRFMNFAEDEKIDGCAVMNSKGKWKIRPCSTEHPFVCQQANY